MDVTYWATAAAVATGLVAFLVTGLRPRLDLPAVAAWAGVVLVGTSCSILLLRWTLDLNSFGAVNLIYRQLVVGVPLAAALIVVRSVLRGWRPSTGLLGRATPAGQALTSGGRSRPSWPRSRTSSGVFVVQGDVDERYELSAIARAGGPRWLSDDVVRTSVGGTRVAIGGLDLDWSSPDARRVVGKLEGGPDNDDVRILLAHRPDAVTLLSAQGARTDLVVAGHTHGGQIVLPLLGPLMTLSDVPRQVAAGGLHAMGRRSIFVSTGVGVERGQAPKVRLLDPPSVAIVTLTST